MSAAVVASARTGDEIGAEALRIDPIAWRVSIAGVEHYLTEREFRLITALAKHPDEQLESELFGRVSGNASRLIDPAAIQLRGKLEPRRAGRLAAPCPGVGFRFDGGAHIGR